MSSAIGDRAIADSLSVGKAILKFITPNDVGLTGSHQCGFYLPRPLWPMYSPFPPDHGKNYEKQVKVSWPDGRVTDSRVKWYGKGTRSEYRFTRFGRDFPWLSADSVGDLLVLIPKSHDEFIAHVLDTEEDIDDIQFALGIEIGESWAIYPPAEEPKETVDDCLGRMYRAIAATFEIFPPGEIFSEKAREGLSECMKDFKSMQPDQLLMSCIEAEYRLFKLVERILCQQDVIRVFKSIDDFLHTAATIMNRRKARAGRSLENHFSFILRREGIPHEMRAHVDGRPDVIIPGSVEYRDESYPVQKLFVMGLKTTCKDRWRQVLNEARRAKRKYILTLQPGISTTQLREMKDSGIVLVVPKPLQSNYPRDNPLKLLTIRELFAEVKRDLSIS